MPVPYSVRSKKPADALIYDISERARSRIFHGISTLCIQRPGSIVRLLKSVVDRCHLQYGVLKFSVTKSHFLDQTMSDQAVGHFMVCNNDEAIDFIEWCFQSDAFDCEWWEEGVFWVNKVFREEGIGFEFSRFVVTKNFTDSSGCSGTKVQYPEAIKKSNEIMHETTVMPALELLSGAIWSVANKEMLQAHDHLRRGSYDDAIHSAGKCLESVFKTICDKKGWSFVPDKDSLNPLIQSCYKNNLFAAPYIEVFQKSSGEIRNKWGGHGQGPIPVHGMATQEMAEHMIQVTSSHIIFLAKLAKL